MTTPTRHETFPADAPVELELHVGAGALRVLLGPVAELPTEDTGGVQVWVAESGGADWRRGLDQVLSSLGVDTAPAGGAAGAVAATQVDFTPGRGRLLVRTPQAGPGRSVPLQVTVAAPAGSRVRARAGSASVEVTGRAAALDVDAGSGAVTVGDVDDTTRVRTGSGDLRTGHLRGGGTLRTGSGDLVVDATAGALDVVTGSGDLRLGIAAGVLAELDVRSGSGRATSELTVSSGAAPGGTAVPVTARTGSGDVLVHPAR